LGFQDPVPNRDIPQNPIFDILKDGLHLFSLRKPNPGKPTSPFDPGGFHNPDMIFEILVSVGIEKGGARIKAGQINGPFFYRKLL
jgi:hypothetical protein